MYIPADTESGAIHEDSNEAGACKGMSHYFYACVTNDWFFVYIYMYRAQAWNFLEKRREMKTSGWKVMKQWSIQYFVLSAEALHSEGDQCKKLFRYSESSIILWMLFYLK